MTDWQVDATTLTTRVGGVIRVGENLIWVAILLITSSASFLSIVSKHFKKRSFLAKHTSFEFETK